MKEEYLCGQRVVIRKRDNELWAAGNILFTVLVGILHNFYLYNCYFKYTYVFCALFYIHEIS